MWWVRTAAGSVMAKERLLRSKAMASNMMARHEVSKLESFTSWGT